MHLVIRLGLPTSILHLIQEMGRCGRERNMNALQNNDDCYHVMFTLQEFVYLTERLYLNDIKQEGELENGETNDIEDTTTIDNTELSIISLEEERQLLRGNLLRCLSLFTLDNGCWHRILEKESGNPFLLDESFQYESDIGCGGNCPHCDGTMSLLIKPVVKTGLIVLTFVR